MNIGYLESKDEDYTKELSKASTLELLKAHLEKWEPLAWDAKDIVSNFLDGDFKKFRKSLASEKSGKFSGDENAAIIMMPETLFKTSLVASQFKCPWGLAFNRLKEVGKIKEENGRYKFVEVEQ